MTKRTDEWLLTNRVDVDFGSIHPRELRTISELLWKSKSVKIKINSDILVWTKIDGKCSLQIVSDYCTLSDGPMWSESDVYHNLEYWIKVGCKR